MLAAVSIAPLQLAPATIAGILYAVRAHTLHQRGRPVPGWRQVSFYSGLTLSILTLTVLGDLAGEAFVWHMAEHLLLGDISALLLVLGLTGPVLAPLLRNRVLGPLRVLTHPAVALPLWAINLYAWHAPVMYEAATLHEGWHALQHSCFIAFGMLMWMPLFGPLPQPQWFGNFAKLIYIIVVRLIGAVLGNVFLWSGHAFYAFYDKPLSDQIAAGAVMMIESSLLTLGLFCWLFLKAANEATERQELIELAQAHGVAVSEERVARAVSAGRGAELRERIERVDATLASG